MWALGAVFTGVSFNYGWLLFARIFTGAGMFSQPVSHYIGAASSVFLRKSSQRDCILMPLLLPLLLHSFAGFPVKASLVKALCDRVLVAAGEASVMTLTGPFIDDVAPPGSKGRWFAWLSLTPTLGVALGYELGNLTQYMSWRILFYIEAGVAVPIILFCLLAPAVRLRGKLTQVSPEGGSTCHLAAVRLPQCGTCVLC